MSMIKKGIEKIVTNPDRFKLTLVDTIGDITVLTDQSSTFVKVDNETVLCIPRKNHGLDQLIDALQKTLP